MIDIALNETPKPDANGPCVECGHTVLWLDPPRSSYSCACTCHIWTGGATSPSPRAQRLDAVRTKAATLADLVTILSYDVDENDRREYVRLREINRSLDRALDLLADTVDYDEHRGFVGTTQPEVAAADASRN